jgi:hypothetical protein
MWSRHDNPFRPVIHEDWSGDGTPVPVPVKERPQFAATGPMGKSWNGGFVCGIRSPVGPIGLHSYAVMPMVDNSAHFIGGWASSVEAASENTTKFNATLFEKWGRANFWGPTIDQWPYFKVLGGWPGLAKLAQSWRVEVGVLRWRHEGWVALQAGTGGATVVTRPILALQHSTVTVNLNTTDSGGTTTPAGVGKCALVHLELPPTNGGNITTPIHGFSGTDAAKVCVDDIAAKLTWGGLTILPASATSTRGVIFRVVMLRGMQLFGLTLHESTNMTPAPRPPPPSPPPSPAPPPAIIPVPNLGTCAGCGCADPCMGFPGPHAHPLKQHPNNCSIPQVLLIGDSIAGPPLGYWADVQRILGTPTQSFVRVHHPGVPPSHTVVVNGSGNPYGIAHVQFVAGFPSQMASRCMWNWTKYIKWSSGGFDVIHFNSGLHDVDLTEFVSPEQYVKNLDAAFTLALKALKPGGKFIWASTTPVPFPTAYALRNNSAVMHYNNLAKELFESKGAGVVGINDLYSDVIARCGEASNELGSCE